MGLGTTGDGLGTTGEGPGSLGDGVPTSTDGVSTTGGRVARGSIGSRFHSWLPMNNTKTAAPLPRRQAP